MSIRWDAVVDRSAADFGRPTPRLPRTAAVQNEALVSVRIRLFGALAAPGAERVIHVQLKAGATVADVLAAAGERVGSGFLARVLDESGAKRRYCRLYVGGHPVDDVRTPLQPEADPADIDVILLIAPEGG